MTVIYFLSIRNNFKKCGAHSKMTCYAGYSVCATLLMLEKYYSYSVNRKKIVSIRLYNLLQIV